MTNKVLHRGEGWKVGPKRVDEDKTKDLHQSWGKRAYIRQWGFTIACFQWRANERKKVKVRL